MPVTLIPPGRPVSLGQEFSLKPNDLARIGEEFFITNGGAVRKVCRDGRDETIARLALRVRGAMRNASDSVSTHPGATLAWNGFRVTVVSVRPDNEMVLRITRA
ncbi:MAG: hypothetical protein FJY76_03670 [Candidatus Aenigmarchaeota archaeon]|nr:hypothetical protein [Candidatus Aenigmarchaeota archaeon]